MLDKIKKKEILFSRDREKAKSLVIEMKHKYLVS